MEHHRHQLAAIVLKFAVNIGCNHSTPHMSCEDFQCKKEDLERKAKTVRVGGKENGVSIGEFSI
jgi:hypothetical protein